MVGDQGARRALRNDAPVIHDRKPLAQALRFFHEMRGEDERLAFGRQPAHALPDEVARLRIEPGGRLVEEKELRVVDERAREREPAFHAARERIDLRAPATRETGELEQRRDARLDLARRHAEVAAVDEQVLGDGEVGIEVVELRHDADPRARFARALRDRLAEQPDLARVRAGSGRGTA